MNAVVQTHSLSITGDVLTKRYVSWERGEHRREWTVLRRVHKHHPDLVPRPLSAELDAVPPVITMTTVPGTPLDGSATSHQLDALETALRALWAVPAEDLAPRRPASDEDLAFARGLLTGRAAPRHGAAGEAYAAALAWFDGPDADHFRQPHRDAVLGHGDPNPANYLFDGQRVRIVDFEDAGRSDVALELATLVEHLGSRGLDADAFLARFDVDPGRLRAARRLWAIFWLHMLLPGGPAAARNPRSVGLAQAERVLTLLDEPG
jgi:Ser/Thr protein kinase RdoA (MazF antagonist)